MLLHRRPPKKKPPIIDPNALKLYWITDIHCRNGVGEDLNAVGAVGITQPRYYYLAPSKVRSFVTKVNAAAPDLAVCTGDMIDRDPQTAIFMNEWNNINPGITKALTIGNHEFEGGATYAQIAAGFGYDTKPLNARSNFNQSFVLDNGVVKAKVIMLDTTMDQNGVHGFRDVGYLNDDALTWLQSELASSVPSTVLIFLHHPPHLFGGNKFDRVDALSIRDVVEAAINARSGLKVNGMFGHYHVRSVTKYTNMKRFVGYNCPSTADFTNSKFTIVNVNGDGSLVMETEWLL